MLIKRFLCCAPPRADYAFRGVGVDVGGIAGVSLSQFPEEKIKYMRDIEGLVDESNAGKAALGCNTFFDECGTCSLEETTC